MKKNSGNVVWRSLLLNSLVVSGILSFKCDRAFSQITPDNTLGDESSVVNSRDANSESIDGGAVRGQNLFHSFEEFNVGEDRGVYFANPDAVTNIFSRVTGGNVSNILGTLGVDGAANLFLINPNGIVFGEGASLDVQGSFTATTADGIEFGEQGFFSAVNPTESVLTISVPLGLQFGSNPGSIINRSFVEDSTGDNVGLQVPAGENLTLVGGDVSFEAGEATARGGNIEIGGLSAAGEVSFNDNSSLNFPDNVARADINLSNAADVDVTGTGGGSVNINARNLNVEAGESGFSLIRAGIIADSTSTEVQAGDITINATDNVTVDNSTVLNQVDSEAVGNAGSINIITGSLTLTNNSLINASTYGQGDAGSINIFAGEFVSLNDRNGNVFIANNVGSDGKGSSGGINITTGSLFVDNGAQIQSLTEGEGDSGKIVINASDIVSFNGRDANDSASAAVSSVEEDAKGNAGGIEISASSLLLTNRAQFSSSTAGTGKAGNIIIQVEEEVKLENSTILSEVTAPNENGISGNGGRGDGGNIIIKADSLLLQDGSSLLADTENVGNAGDITIDANERIILEGEGLDSFPGDTNVVPSQISSTVDNFEGAKGEGGNISISTSLLSIADNGFVSTDTYSRGDAGNITINASFLKLDNNAFIINRSESAFDAGDITLNIADFLQATNSLISTSSIQSSGGNLTITAGDIQLRGDSDITTNIFSGEGSGGNIAIKANSVIAFDDSDIFAFARDGRGGNITLDTPAFFAENFTFNSLTAENTQLLENNNRADVNATGNKPGVVSVPDVSFIQNSLTELENNSINTDELVANSCVSPVGDRQQGKFIITGGQSLPVRPGDGIPSKYPTGEVRNVPEGNHSSWRSGDPIVEPQGAYRLANGKLVLSRECSN